MKTILLTIEWSCVGVSTLSLFAAFKSGSLMALYPAILFALAAGGVRVFAMPETKEDDR